MARTLFGIIAALLFAVAGLMMVELRSVGGGTVAEAFYNYFGIALFGVAALTIVIASPSRASLPKI